MKSLGNSRAHPSHVQKSNRRATKKSPHANGEGIFGGGGVVESKRRNFRAISMRKRNKPMRGAFQI